MKRITIPFLCFLLGSCAIFCRRISAQSRRLDDYLKAAKTSSPLLRNYANQLDNNRIEGLLVKAFNRPQVLANGQLAIYPVISGYGYDQAVTNGGNYSAVISASQPLLNGKKLAPRYRQIAIQREMLFKLNGSGRQLDMLFKIFISNSYSPEFVVKLGAGYLNSFDLFPVRFVNAASWFISRACIEKTGLFDPLFYHYGEDNNYSSRAQYHGFKVGITPLAAIRHDKSHDLPGKISPVLCVIANEARCRI